MATISILQNEGTPFRWLYLSSMSGRAVINQLRGKLCTVKTMSTDSRRLLMIMMCENGAAASHLLYYVAFDKRNAQSEQKDKRICRNFFSLSLSLILVPCLLAPSLVSACQTKSEYMEVMCA